VLGIVESPAFLDRSLSSTPDHNSVQRDKSTLKAEVGSDGRIRALIAAKPLQVSGGSR
jgi:hypothetical protein